MLKDLQGFFESTTGQIMSVAIVVVIFIIILIPGKGSQHETGKARSADVKALTISALMVALAVGLNQISFIRMPYGGSITLLSMLPIVLCGYFLGTKKGVLAGFVFGILNLIFNPFVIHPVQLLLDYPIAYGTLGMSGIYRNKKNGLIKGYLFGIFCRYLCSVLSGIIFFGSYADEGFNAFTWSIWYNGIYTGAEGFITVAILLIPPVRNALESLKKQI